MNSFIIFSHNTSVQQEYVKNFCKEKGISIFDQTVITTDDASLGIEDVRNLQKTVYLRPKQGSEKACIIQDAEKLTPEAQNALLKLLEEPPAHTYLLLLVSTTATLLPTILSRCTLIALTEKTPDITTDEKNTYGELIQRLLHGSIGEQLAIAQELSAKKEEIAGRLETLIRVLREELSITEKRREVALLLASLQDAYTTYQTTNVSPRLLLEHTFLTILENSDNSVRQNT